LPICNIQLVAQKPCYLPFPCEKDKSLGAALKRRRLALTWTQRNCANHFGVLKDSYQNWEWNGIIPSLNTRKPVNKFLNLNFWDDESNSLANRVLLYRINHGLKQSELAKLIRVSPSTIHRKGIKFSFEKFNEICE